jgi:hypothetical protein
MIKKFNQFVKENVSLSNSAARIYIDSDEAEMFTTEPALQKLVADRKVSLLPPELYFEAEDKSTIEILKGYFPDVDFEDDFEDEHYSGDDEDEDDSDGFDDDDYEMSNEEINLKGLAAGAMMALMTACHDGEINGEPSEGYTGDMLVKKIEMGGGKYNHFLVHGLDEKGKYVEFRTDNLTFNVGDSIHVDFSKEEAYPLDDKENIGKF